VGAERAEPMVEHARRLRVAAAVGGEAKGDLFKQVYCCVNLWLACTKQKGRVGQGVGSPSVPSEQPGAAEESAHSWRQSRARPGQGEGRAVADSCAN